ncbi:membrane protein [Rhodococcus ruber Chol-4]|mgnify:CR=1 FL=1|uniref:Manganese transport system membrane protein MntB n=1 Tax=Rhodococcus ruber TaxID=1830 RepID=A0A098BKI0_9NOCA|nr:MULTISPECIES: metal ABC transporter permease [Rhodococcus]MDO2377727.1 metal ABC transporter permease [Rhodococcus ruber]RIK13904.1 MAG: metal ABC transporter permease [Acidobacteriota bacterium]ATQ27521.1 metal ABC transporter permease [Rhodococcus ruber]AUM15510.1 metal ABC transporter permease [Rhodococcus ruber]AWG98891.1 metal ABC transporter permease [Rhodococcus ruber]
MNLVELIVEPLQYGFMQRALVVAVAATIVCALLSCWLVLIGWSLMGDAVSHAVLPGVVLAYLVGAPFAVGALLFAGAAVALIGLVRNTTKVKEDAAIGVVFTTLFALGVVLISKNPSQVDLHHVLFGNLLGLATADMWQVTALAVVVLVVLIAKRRDLTLFAFDRGQAHALGISPARLSALLLALLAVTIVAAIQAVGVILVVAMLIIPGATAYLLTERLSRMLVLAPTLAALTSATGVYVSYYTDASTGGVVVLAQAVVFTMAYLFSPHQGLVTGALRRRTRLREPDDSTVRVA